MLTQLYYADFTQMIYAIHYALYAFITQIIYADFTQIIYAIHYAVYAIHLRRHIYAITIISLRRLRKYRFHYASLRKGQLADEHRVLYRRLLYSKGQVLYSQGGIYHAI